MKVLRFGEFLNESKNELGKIELTFVGDIKYNKEISETDNFFNEVEFIFKNSDGVIGNLETGFHGEFANEDNKLSADDHLLERLKKVGFTHLSIANNHILDYGLEGYQRTKGILEENEVGVIENKNDLKIGNYNLSVHSFTCGLNNAINEEIEKFLTDSEAIPNNESDLNIAYVHWESKSNENQDEIIQGLINRGYNLILGSGNHKLDEINLSEKNLTTTSLGDFLSSEKSEGGILKVILTEGIITDVVLYEVEINEKSEVIYKQRKIIK